MLNEQTHIDTRPYNHNGQTAMITALWVLVALTFFLNYQLMQLSGDVKQLQAESQRSSLTPAGPAPGTPEGGQYSSQLETISSKLDRINGNIETITGHVGSIKNDTASLHGTGSSSGGFTQPPNQ